MEKKRCGGCRHLTGISGGLGTNLCEVKGYGVVPGDSCSRWKSKVPRHKRALLFILYQFKGIYFFFRYPWG